jgi:hypothetical protein
MNLLFWAAALQCGDIDRDFTYPQELDLYALPGHIGTLFLAKPAFKIR